MTRALVFYLGLFFLFEFRRKRIIYALGVFLISQFAAIKTSKIIVFNKSFSYSIEEIDYLKSNVKIFFTSDHFFCRSSGSLKMAKLVMLRTKLCVL